jgi:coronin-1B/1C/6
MIEPLQTLTGHKRKVGTVRFSPTANNILATSASDFSVKIWDVEKGKDVLSVDGQHTDFISAAEWNWNGSQLATASKDRKVRVLDPRTQSVVAEVEAHTGIKASRVIWLRDKLLSVGFTKQSEREYCLWDPRDLSKAISRTNVDTSSGILMPFFDPDTNMVFMAGKGDGNIRYFEYVEDQLFYLSEFKTSTPQRGLGMMPKRGVSVSECEVTRMYKLSVKILEPISFQVPRKSDIFQDDIFPDCLAGEAALSSEEWLAGQNAEPKLQSLAGGFVERKAPAEFNPVVVQTKELSVKELNEELTRLQTRVAYLEAEIVKKDAKIKSLEQ